MRNSEARTDGMRSGSGKLETIAHQQAGEPYLTRTSGGKITKNFCKLNASEFLCNLYKNLDITCVLPYEKGPIHGGLK